MGTMSSRSHLLFLAVASSCVLSASPAGAEETSGPLRLSLGAAATRFQQGSGSPPPCCYEREDWRTWGPEVQARALYQAKPWLLPGIELGFGFLFGTHGVPVERLRVTQRTLRASPTLAFHFGGRVFLEPRVALHYVRIDARFEQLLTFRRTTEETDNYFGAGAGLSLGFNAAPRWAPK